MSGQSEVTNKVMMEAHESAQSARRSVEDAYAPYYSKVLTIIQ
jgi:phosphoribosyl-AMP cyclohydrolase